MSERERIAMLRKRETLPSGLMPKEQREALDVWQRALDERDECRAAYGKLFNENAAHMGQRDEARELVRRLVQKPTEADWDSAESRLRAWEQEAK